MSDELPPHTSQAIHDAAREAFRAHAQDAKAPLAKARSVWRRRFEPYVIAALVSGFAAWALWRVFG
jgi:hypothetical protein